MLQSFCARTPEAKPGGPQAISDRLSGSRAAEPPPQRLAKLRAYLCIQATARLDDIGRNWRCLKHVTWVAEIMGP